MGAGGMPPGQDPPVRAEIVHQSGRTRVTRLFLPERTVIRKEPLGPDADRRLRHEGGDAGAAARRRRGRATGAGAAVPGVGRAGGRGRREPGRAGQAAGGR